MAKPKRNRTPNKNHPQQLDKQPSSQWLDGIDCCVRESRRAKHVSIKISTWGEVEVVVPVGFDQERVPHILNKREAWIRSTQDRMFAERAQTSTPADQEHPHEACLRSIDETWKIRYSPESLPGVTAKVTAPRQLTLTGDVEHVSLCRSVLGQWIRSYAQHHLPRQLNDVSQKCGLTYQNLTIRRQKTRWGSCSNQHNINLNDKLLFLPPELVHYVLVHELCHTIHLNHSKQFWALVEQHESDYRQLDHELRTAWRYIPHWLEL